MIIHHRPTTGMRAIAAMRVVATGRAWSEYLTVPAEFGVPVPDAVSAVAAGAMSPNIYGQSLDWLQKVTTRLASSGIMPMLRRWRPASRLVVDEKCQSDGCLEAGFSGGSGPGLVADDAVGDEAVPLLEGLHGCGGTGVECARGGLWDGLPPA